MRDFFRRLFNRAGNFFRTDVLEEEMLAPVDDSAYQELESVVVVETPVTEPALPAVSTWQIISNLSAIMFAAENRLRLGAATGLTFAGMSVNFLAPFLLGETVKLLSSDDDHTNIAGVEFSRPALITFLVTTYAAMQIIPIIRDQVMVTYTQRNTKKLLYDGTAHMVQQPLYRFNTESLSDKFYFLNKLFAVSETIRPILVEIIPTVIEIPIACVFMSRTFGLEMGIANLGVLITFIAYSKLTANPIILAREESLKEGLASFEKLCSAISQQYKPIRDFGQFDHAMKRVDDSLEKMIKANIKANIRPLQVTSGNVLMVRGAMLASLLYAGLNVKSGKFTSQDFIILAGYLNQLSSQLPGFGQAVNQIFAAMPDLRFVFNEFARTDGVIDSHPHVPLELNGAPTIEFDKVTFAFPPKDGEEAQLILNEFSCKIEAGGTTVFVSESGGGKTTIFNLLVRDYTPQSGVIRINGQDISQVSLHSLQRIGLISQNPNLFKGTIRENICFGAKNPLEVTDEEIWALAEKANLADFLHAFPDKLDTDVGENGKALSGGQQQKVALLRGLMKPCVVRLLDEITAPFDSNSAAKAMQAIERFSPNVTTLSITHKLTEAQSARQIIVLEEGRVIAQGAHEELLTSCSLYHKLWTAYHQDESLSSSSQVMRALGGEWGMNVLSEEAMTNAVDAGKGKGEAEPDVVEFNSAEHRPAFG